MSDQDFIINLSIAKDYPILIATLYLFELFSYFLQYSDNLLERPVAVTVLMMEVWFSIEALLNYGFTSHVIPKCIATYFLFINFYHFYIFLLFYFYDIIIIFYSKVKI